jgi:ABC-2 type transport system permease protein
MKRIWLIAMKDVLLAYRDRRLVLLAGLFFALLMLSAGAGYAHYQFQREHREHAQQEKRAQWLGQEEKHPHIAAHFGTFVFRPKTYLSFLDFGVDSYAGTSVYLEAHRQHDFMFSPAQEFSGMIRFGELSMGALLQLLAPLLIFALCHASFAGEKEAGTLRFLVGQGVSLRNIVLGKIAASYAMVLGSLLMPAALTAFIFSLAGPGDGHHGLGARPWLLFAGYAVYFLVCTVFAVLISSWCRQSRTALLALLGVWVAFSIFMPRIFAHLADARNPLPSASDFRQAVQDDMESVPRGQWLKALEDSVLAAHNADTVTGLPFNFEGLMMYMGEERSSLAYDRHFGELRRRFLAQSEWDSRLSLLDPFMAVRNLSMALASTDFRTQMAFQRQAEEYRRSFVQAMNLDQIQHSRYGDWDYKVGREKWESIPDFAYRGFSLSEVLHDNRVEILSLGIWLLLGVGLAMAAPGRKSVTV